MYNYTSSKTDTGRQMQTYLPTQTLHPLHYLLRKFCEKVLKSTQETDKQCIIKKKGSKNIEKKEREKRTRK